MVEKELLKNDTHHQFNVIQAQFVLIIQYLRQNRFDEAERKILNVSEKK